MDATVAQLSYIPIFNASYRSAATNTVWQDEEKIEI